MLRKHFNATTIIAIVALVFAMTGGAYAVTSKGGGGNAVIAAKKKSKKPAVKGVVGPRGPEGKQGPAGPEGKEGKQGTEGKAGAAGANGTSVTIASLAAGNANCALGGAEFTGTGGPGYACNGAEGKAGKAGKNGESVEVTALTKGSEPNEASECKELGGAKISNEAGTQTAFACNGGAGASGGGGTLGSGEIETGYWWGEFTQPVSSFDLGYIPVSLPRPLSVSQPSGYEEVKEGETKTGGFCHGDISKPEPAGENILCIYVAEQANLDFIAPQEELSSGFRLRLLGAAAGKAYGTWAIEG